MVYSQNQRFVIDMKNPYFLYSTFAELPPLKFIRAGNIGKTPYNQFTYNQEFFNDCLGFAEYLATGERSNTKCLFREKTTDKLFGSSPLKNRKIAREAFQDENANPLVGEAYSIVTRIDTDEVPYHAAYVMFKDGTTNITLEADAGNEILSRPMFDMYDTVDPKQTFHARYKDMYKPASTIVLKPR